MANYANQTTRLIKQSIPVFPTQTSFTQLFGDTFAQNPASSLYLLEDLLGIGADLTNNNAVTFDSVTDLIISPVNVATLDGVNQYLSTPTATANQVGSGSFVASIWFKTTIESGLDTLFMYGNTDTNEQNWELLMTSGNLQFEIDDGTNIAFYTHDEAIYSDDKWHVATMLVDRDPLVNLMYLFVDGKLLNIGGTDISAVTGTLDNIGTNLYLGARAAPSVGQTWGGQLANFSLYIADAADNTVPPDYNLPALLEAGLRESAALGTQTLGIQASGRLNNVYWSNGTGNDGDYVMSVINVSEGIYELQQIGFNNTDYAIVDISIDGEVVTTQDLYAGSLDFLTSFSQTGIYLTAGTHILKWQVNGRNPANTTGYEWLFSSLSLIKREGANEGDNECSSGVLFGDEIQQTGDDTWAPVVSSVRVFNQQFVSANAEGSNTQGTLFLKKGNYKVTFHAATFASGGTVEVSFGGVSFSVDTYSLGTEDNAAFEKFVFLEGGKTPIKLNTITRNGSSGGDTILMTHIRFELVSGKSNGDNVNIWAADDDIQIVVGATPIVGIATNSRFNFQRSSNSANSNSGDTQQYNRYFSGGTYKVKLVYWTLLSGGIMDIGIDNQSTAIFNQLDTYDTSGGTPNQEAFATVTISRGFHDITFLVNGKNVSSTDFRFLWQFIQFTKIADIEDAENDDNSDPVHGALVPLGSLKIPAVASSFQIDLGGVDLINRFSKVKVLFLAEANGQLETQGIINGNRGATDYRQDGLKVIAGTVTGVDASRADIALVGSDIVTGAGANIKTEFDIAVQIDESVNHLIGQYTGGAPNLGYASGNYLLAGSAGDNNIISQIIVEASATSYKANGQLLIYGVLR